MVMYRSFIALQVKMQPSQSYRIHNDLRRFEVLNAVCISFIISSSHSRLTVYVEFLKDTKPSSLMGSNC